MDITTRMGEAPTDGLGGVWDRRLLLDLTGCRIEAARGEPAIRDFCRDLAEALDLRPSTAPALTEAGGPDARAGEWSLTHTLHGATVTGAFTDRDGGAHLCILAHHVFAVEPVLRVARKHFAPQRVSETVLTRQT